MGCTMGMGIFCIKILGNGFIFLSGSLLGWHYSLQVQKRHEELNEWKHHMHTICGDVAYGGVTLYEIICHVGSQNCGAFRMFFQYMEQEIAKHQQCQLHEIWKQGIETQLNEVHLTREDKMELLRIGQNLGNVDKEQQLVMLQLHLEKIDYIIREMERDMYQKMKLYKVLGCIGSMFVIILFL